MVQLTEPLKMFGVYVESFTSSVGYGAESSTMQMTLVEDPDDNITLKHSLDSGATFIAGFPTVGTVCQFQFEGFEFVGIFQRYNYSQSTGGNKYDVTFESPSKVLDGVQVILSGFEGTGFWNNPIYPSEDWNFTSQLNNVYNPFGVKENYAWGGTFGFSDYNSAGFPVTDDPNLTGLAANGLLTMIEEISQSKYVYDNPLGASIHTSVNSSGEELIGGPICYGDSKFVIDFGNLKTLVPNFFRLKGPTKSINSILNECCELIVHDYVTIIKPVYTQVLTGRSSTTTGFAPGVPQGQYQNVIRNGVVPTQYDVDGNVTGPVISFKYLDKSVQPQPGVVASLVAAARLNDTLISANNGQEYADVVTQKMIIGDDATRVWEAGMEYLIPVYGKDNNGDWLIGAGFGRDDNAPVALPNGGVYQAKIMELRAAMSGFEQWSLYHELGGLYGYSNVGNPLFGSLAMGAAARINAYVSNRMPGGAVCPGYNGDYHKRMIQSSLGSKDNGKEIFDAVLNTATNFWGKTYFVMLPVEPGGLENNIRYKNAFETESAWEIADAGWDPYSRIRDISAYNDEGALKAHAGYYPSHTSGGNIYLRDFGGVEKTVPYTGPFRTLVGAEIKVDKQIYWQNNPYLNDPNNPYDDVSAMVHIECPQVFEEDGQSTIKGGLDSLMDSAVGASTGGPAGLAGAPGFRGTRANQGFTPYTYNYTDDNGQQQQKVEQVSNYSTFENEMMHFKYLPTVARPFKVSIPQKSTRYSWGPWYRFSTKIGKAEVEKNSQLKPETFGSKALLDEAGAALTYAGTADLYASESGSVDLAEFPQYNIADRFNTNGPYITKMDISVGAGGITTKYQFSTWTRNFGKIAKYNIDRIAKINKDRIKALKEGTLSLPALGQNSNVTALQEHANALNPIDTNFMSGLQVPAGGTGSAQHNPLGPSVWSMSTKNAASLHFSSTRVVDFQGKSAPSYNFSFGCTPDQLFSPVGVRKEPNDGEGDPNNNIPADILPYVLEPTRGKNIDADLDTDGGADHFYEGHMSPTSRDLDPYALSRDEPNMPERMTHFVKLDFGAVLMDDMDWLLAKSPLTGETNNMHLANNGNTVPNDVDEVRTFGLRGPLLLSGWGYDIMGHPVPGKKDGEFEPPNPAENRSSWKTGPVDLKWDDERQVWAGGLQFIEGILETEIKPATDAVDTPDTTGTMKVYRRTNKGAGLQGFEWTDEDKYGQYGTITLTNRDPSLTVDPAAANYKIYVMAVRINQEWRVVYVSCDNKDAGV
jgi:hypothetical protein